MATTSIFNKPFLESFDEIFLEPYRRGAQSIQVAWRGKTIQHPIEDVSTIDRIGHVVIGLILLIPIINAIAFAVIKVLSECLNTSVDEDLENLQVKDPNE